ncbi:hypothetical protein K439DRAFT_1350706 [Ramaria rubella]|nr:hypothetical protein K439DRAFT_1350706 [Ramaria rubella]
MERWVLAGQGKQVSTAHEAQTAAGKHVGWADSDADDSVVESELNRSDNDENEPTISATVYKGKSYPDIRPGSLADNATTSPLRRPNFPSDTLQLSPLRGAAAGNNPIGNGGAQELLRAVVNDVMYEYRQETKDDIKGLHLDLLRMGRSWKSELRSLMNEYVGDLRELREENVKLRKENERLRRGF